MKFCSRAYFFRSMALNLALLGAAKVYADGGIRINVENGQTQRPISEAVISITARDGSVKTVESGQNGTVVVDGLPAGLFEVSAQFPNFLVERFASVRVIDGKITPLTASLIELSSPIEETLVTASGAYRNTLNTVSASELDREALRSAAGGGGDVLRSLDGLPGLFSDGEFSSFTVRGNGPRDNLILVDDIPFANVIHFSDSFGEGADVESGGRYSIFAPNLISSVEYQPGGWGPKYGGLAGSLLKLNVAEGNQDSSTSTLRLDIAGLELGYDGPSHIHEDTSVLLSARSLDFSNLFGLVGVDDVGEPKLTDIIVKTTSLIDSANTLNVLAIYSDESFLRDEAHAIASDEDLVGNYTDVELVDASTTNQLFALTWSSLMGENSELNTRLFFRSNKENSMLGEAFPDLSSLGTSASEITSRPDILRSSRSETESGLRLDFSTENKFGVFESGLRASTVDLDFRLNLQEDWVRYTFSSDEIASNPSQKFVVWTPELIDNSYQQSEVNYGAYLNQNMSLGKLEFRTGLRFDYDGFSQQSMSSPRLGATWYLGDSMRLTSTLGRYFQAPRFDQRAIDSGNRSLSYETIDQASIGIVIDLSDNYEFLLEPYVQKQSDLIVEADGIERGLVNTGEGRTYGVDTVLSRQFMDGWSANITYSYNQSEVKDNATSAYYDSEYNRPHAISLGGVWEINARWKLSARWKWASGKTKDEHIVHSDVHNSTALRRFSRETISENTARYDGFSSLNFRADYRKAFGKTNLIAFVDVVNLLGSTNPSNSEFNERSGLSVAEEGEALPILGFRLEW